jgi:hypothetical protein
VVETVDRDIKLAVLAALEKQPQGTPDEIAKTIAKTYQDLVFVRTEVRTAELEFQDARSIYEAAQKTDTDRLARARARCPHIETHYQPDPSGGRDSSTTCCLCKKEW